MSEPTDPTPHQRAAALRAAGMGNEEIFSTLTGEGFDPDTARMLIAALGPVPAVAAQVQLSDGRLATLPLPPGNDHAVPGRANRSAGMTQIAIGGLMLLFGGGVTLATFSSASERGGGTYFLMWGPMIFGVIRIMKGIGLLTRGV